MRNRKYSSLRRGRTVEINMAPLIDMIFILLIFFIVTTSFVKESGVDVQRPKAASAVTQEKTNVIIAVTKEGQIYMDGRLTDIRSVRGFMERFLAETPEGSVVITADENSRTGEVIHVLDACRLAGVQNISVAARKE
ncbi:Biopolymer transport protein ExbD/TolR [Denitrovibrio acetiphilus DSM 12809]|uniref:Biopolymer transport protein ExbD/TolR n=1 Tax=Denitrovibrio acetiphilus (strain DSM 12809 / NBRC 114555 / N2460) TaxID=522772 RepID=D4H8M6_DENA2|nr:biopolymer transporter ExbD [Denitrovibrio acetiphilus]ADD68375.1 Biopolymer transport protein ExbD/TolR [Denitrovibrio acetiphilus DSM 12809]